MRENLKQAIASEFNLYLNRNQLRDTERLVFEIVKREKTTLTKVIAYLKANPPAAKCSPSDKFSILKDRLIKRRFPLTSGVKKIEPASLFLNQIHKPLAGNWIVKPSFKPLTIIVEKKVRNSSLLASFEAAFPNVKIEEITHCSQYLKTHKFKTAELKKPLVFIVEEKYDFLKPCPCTKYHLGCGYWIFNLGFGCPFDCSYCYLQQYTNFCGITLPANIESFFECFDRFINKANRPLRIGSGEFGDSLALDPLTGYSQKLVPYFSQKKVLFELKTKSAHVANLLNLKAANNIIISWSLNPQVVIDSEEIGSAPLKERLRAAAAVQAAGYRVAFHFDPIIYLGNWRKLYSTVVKELYSCLKPPLAWISLGTLRSNRKLKTVAEQRFPQSNIFYGELFLGRDQKLRYPEFIRTEIYSLLVKTIRTYDPDTPLYLCMESRTVWAKTKGLVPVNNIEKSLSKVCFR